MAFLLYHLSRGMLDLINWPLELCCHCPLTPPVKTLADDRARVGWVRGSAYGKGCGNISCFWICDATRCPEFGSSSSLFDLEDRCPSLSPTCLLFSRLVFVFSKENDDAYMPAIIWASLVEVAFLLWAPVPLQDPGAPMWFIMEPGILLRASVHSANQGLNWLVSYKQHSSPVDLTNYARASGQGSLMPYTLSLWSSWQNVVGIYLVINGWLSWRG